MNGMKILGTATLAFTLLFASQVEASKEKAMAPAKKAVPMMSFEECCDLHGDTGKCQALANVKEKTGKSCPKIEEDEYIEMEDSDMDSVDE